MATLDGTGIPVDLGSGVSLLAPGLLGVAEREPELLGGRAGEEPPATPALAAALAEAGLAQVHGVQVSAEEVPVLGEDVRGPNGEDAMVLSVPDLGPGSPQVLLLVDEEGLATWHYPEPGSVDAPGTLDFTVRRSVSTSRVEGAADAGDRGLAAAVGRKLLSVLVFPALEAGAGMAARLLAERYERTSRPYRLRRFAPGQTRAAGAGDLALEGWSDLGDGPALLFIHGTFSTSHGGFSGLPDTAVQTLWSAYDGRVLAFDHPTLSVTPQQNVEQLLSMVPAGRSVPVDVIAHSRGGLVARALADAIADQERPPLQLRSTVFVATPNAGTALAGDANIKAFIDRMTTMLNLIPDGPWSVVTDVLAGVLDLVKIVAMGAVGGLPGLQAMDPTDLTLATLGDRGDPSQPRYAIDAEYEPTGSLLSLVRAKDTVVDRIFGSLANDLVVPTDGAAGPAGRPGFPVPAKRRLSFGRTGAVWHSSFFSQPETIQRLNQWCRPARGLSE